MGHPLPVHWPDPAQRHRLTEIRDNLTARIAEAEREAWAGEVEGLKISLAGAASRDSTVPAKALRTGTAVRPRPGSSASRMPTAAATLVGHAVSRERGPVAAGLPLRRAPADARRRAGQTTRVTSSITMAAAPAASTVTSALTPGSGSARAAASISMSGDAATASSP